MRSCGRDHRSCRSRRTPRPGIHPLPARHRHATNAIARGCRFACPSARHRPATCPGPGPTSSVRTGSSAGHPPGPATPEEARRWCTRGIRRRTRPPAGAPRPARDRRRASVLAAPAAGRGTGLATPPADSPVLSFLRRVHERHRTNTAGSVATYIPELALADPASFGIVIATVDGAVYEIGDTRTPFTIQSMAKPLTYAAIVDRLGPEAVRERIGVEPTGDAFNAISLGAGTGMPLNPMVNAGAITAVGMMPDTGAGTHPEGGRLAALVASLGRFAGRDLTIDEAVYVSERDTGHRNRAIAHLLRGTGAIADDDPDAVVDAYFKVCAVSVTARDLALIAATLASGGRHPLTGEEAARGSTVRDVLSVMATCGMYDGAGEWMYEVGLPAKSGVSGGIFAVLPGQLGIGVWSPPLDARGNSVRGVAVCRDLARELDLHLVRGLRPPSAVRTRANVVALPSKRNRGAHERERISADGERSLVDRAPGEPRIRRRRDARPRGPPRRWGCRRGRRGPPPGAADRPVGRGPARGPRRRTRGARCGRRVEWRRDARGCPDGRRRGARRAPPRPAAPVRGDGSRARVGGGRGPEPVQGPGDRIEAGAMARAARRAPGVRRAGPRHGRLPRAGDGASPVPLRRGARAPRRARRRAVRHHRRPALGVGAGRGAGHAPSRDARGGAAGGRARVPRPRASDRGRLLRHRGRGVRADDRRLRRARRSPTRPPRPCSSQRCSASCPGSRAA